MPRRPIADLTNLDTAALLDHLSRFGTEPPPMEDQAAVLRALHARDAEVGGLADDSVLLQLKTLREGLQAARAHQSVLESLFEQLTAEPWPVAVFLGLHTTSERPSAIVAVGGGVRAVAIGPSVSVEELRVGDEVLLGKELNVVMARSPAPFLRVGETAEFQQVLDDGRLVLKQRDEEVVVRAAYGLDAAVLAPGQRVRWNRAVGLAFESVPRTGESSLFLEHTPVEGFDRIGGLDRQIAEIRRALDIQVVHRDAAARYRLRPARGILLVGPPGTGKTMIARAIANWLARHSPSGRSRFMAIKPGELHSMWYGQSEANYREAFRVAREAASNDSAPVVIFVDELDGLAAARGTSLTRVDDHVTTAFAAELDGLADRGNIVVVAATNRRDALDPAIARPGRLGDVVVEIPRPGMVGAAAILERHLSPEIPYAGVADSAGCRHASIAAVVSRLYAPNGLGDVAKVMFRDGTSRSLRARDVMSGANLANIARAAVEGACCREIEGGEPGVRTADLLDAAAREIGAAVAALTPANCHLYVTGLPQDLTVVRVEPIAARPGRPHQFISAA